MKGIDVPALSSNSVFPVVHAKVLLAEIVVSVLLVKGIDVPALPSNSEFPVVPAKVLLAEIVVSVLLVKGIDVPALPSNSVFPIVPAKTVVLDEDARVCEELDLAIGGTRNFNRGRVKIADEGVVSNIEHTGQHRTTDSSRQYSDGGRQPTDRGIRTPLSTTRPSWVCFCNKQTNLDGESRRLVWLLAITNHSKLHLDGCCEWRGE